MTDGPASKPVPSVALVILDGWGLAPDGPGNAISLADTPTFDALWAKYPHAQLRASGRDVGLPEGQMGNSEVGHLNLGAGAVIRQDLTRIDDAVADGELSENASLRLACAEAKDGPHGRLHLIGLVSDGGVHSSLDHLRAIIELAGRHGVPEIVVHAFTDGRDTLPKNGPGYVETLKGWLDEVTGPNSNTRGTVGTVGGRYYAMDRDRRWERTKLAYDAIIHGRGERADDAVEAVLAAHDRGETDEFVLPTVIGDYEGAAEGDVFIHFNFRPDRTRQLVRAIGEPIFDEFDRSGGPAFSLTTLTEYQAGWSYRIAFPPQTPEVTLAQVISEEGGHQLHVAETEKYAHVTYFFNGGREAEWTGEERRLVPSPRDVPTYDHKPEMSAAGACQAFIDGWNSQPNRFGIINFANPDMVGHTGSIPAAVKAVEAVDTCLAQVVEAVHASGGTLIITADHGNADNMLEPDGSPNTAHSLNPVPVIITTAGLDLVEEGILADVAPTVLDLLGIAQPAAMTGTSLIR